MIKNLDPNEEKFEIPKKYRNMIDAGNMKNKHKNSPLILQPHQGYYREDDEEFEVPEKFKNIINTGRLRNKEGKLPVPPIEYSYFIESNNA